MKRIALIAALLCFTIAAGAQTYTGDANVKVNGRDTLTNADTDTTTFTATGAKEDFTIFVDFYKISGTVAGTVKYYYSCNNGVTYYLAETDNLTDASGAHTYEKNYMPGNKWMVVTATTGTSSSGVDVWIRTNK